MAGLTSGADASAVPFLRVALKTLWIRTERHRRVMMETKEELQNKPIHGIIKLLLLSQDAVNWFVAGMPDLLKTLLSSTVLTLKRKQAPTDKGITDEGGNRRASTDLTDAPILA